MRTKVGIIFVCDVGVNIMFTPVLFVKPVSAFKPYCSRCVDCWYTACLFYLVLLVLQTNVFLKKSTYLFYNLQSSVKILRFMACLKS